MMEGKEVIPGPAWVGLILSAGISDKEKGRVYT